MIIPGQQIYRGNFIDKFVRLRPPDQCFGSKSLDALQKSGALALLVDSMSQLLGDLSPRLMLMVLFVLAASIGLFISNTATALLLAPVAIGIAQQMGLSPYPFAITVAIAASAAFMTPVSSPVNTLVLVPGGYRFSDFIRLGVPFTLLVMAVTVLVVPLLFPFQPG